MAPRVIVTKAGGGWVAMTDEKAASGRKSPGKIVAGPYYARELADQYADRINAARGRT